MRLTVTLALSGLFAASLTSLAPHAGASAEAPPNYMCKSERDPRAAQFMTDWIRQASLAGRGTGDNKAGIGLYEFKRDLECWSEEGAKIQTASMVKLTILMALMRVAQLEGRELTPQEKELAEPMITESRNSAADELFKRLHDPASPNDPAKSKVKALLDAVRANDTELPSSYSWGTTKTTARDQIYLMKILCQDNTVLDFKRRLYVLELMRQAQPRFGLTALQPNNTVLNIKTGLSNLEEPYNYRVNAVGRIKGGSDDKYDYVMAILTDKNVWPGVGQIRSNAVGMNLNAGMQRLSGEGPPSS